MDLSTIECESVHRGKIGIEEDLDEHFSSIHHVIHGSEKTNVDINTQNNILACSTTTTYPDNEGAEDKLVCYHERTSSCESAASSLSYSSYSSSNASGILLNVSKLGPCSKYDEVKFTLPNNFESPTIVENTINAQISSTIPNQKPSQDIVVLEQSNPICDVLLKENDSEFVLQVDNSKYDKKPVCGDISSNSSSNIKDSKKPKKLIDFSVIKLRGRNILLHKHGAIKMGQSANSASCDVTPSNNAITISSSQKNSMDSSQTSNILELKTPISCDSNSGKIDEIDNRFIGNRPEPEGYDSTKDRGTMSFANPVTDVPKNAAYLKLEAELGKALAELKTKEEEILKLSRIRDDVESEMQELTASLFQEAHRMVGEANVKRASAEKLLIEANMKIDGLETEVAALKTLVLTSTPSQPNRHLHPQLTARDNKTNTSQMKVNGQGSNNNSLLQGYVFCP